MKVVTLSPPEFAGAVCRLEQLSVAFDPDLVVGIATGGDIVARRMFAGIEHLTITSRRPSTAVKSRVGNVIWHVVCRLPLWLRNVLRIMEARILSCRSSKRLSPLELNASAVASIRQARRVLVVDDAIDSGATMRRVLDAVGKVRGVRSVAVAVVAHTMDKSAIIPDYRLYGPGVLVRFPWSKDFCGK